MTSICLHQRMSLVGQWLALALINVYFSWRNLDHAQSLTNHCVQKCVFQSLFLFYQSQQKQMQEILKHLSQQDEKNKESQQLLGQHLNNEAQKQNCLIEQLRQMVAEREAKVKELEEEIGQLTLQVVRRNELEKHACNHFRSAFPLPSLMLTMMVPALLTVTSVLE